MCFMCVCGWFVNYGCSREKNMHINQYLSVYICMYHVIHVFVLVVVFYVVSLINVSLVFVFNGVHLMCGCMHVCM